MDVSVVVPTVAPRSEVAVIQHLDRCEFEDYEVAVRDDVPVSKARNEGDRRATGDKVVFFDDDSMPRDGYLHEASQTLADEAAVAGRTIHPRDDVFAGQLTTHCSFGDHPRYVDRFWGCNIGVRKDALEAVGGCDEAMGWGHEEKELAERLQWEVPIYYNPDMVVDHVYAESLRDYWRKKYQLEQGTPYYLRKQGLSRRQILFRTVSDVLSPLNYLGRPVPLTAARAGSTVSGALGRLTGLADARLEAIEDERASIDDASRD